jgi:hypothetical protein
MFARGAGGLGALRSQRGCRHGGDSILRRNRDVLMAGDRRLEARHCKALSLRAPACR